RYMMLSTENRESRDKRSLGELFLYFSDEMSDITWIQAFQLLLQMFRTLLTDDLDIAEDAFDALVDAFMDTLPALLKSKLQAS
ncbi:transposase, partial [Schaedlerella arabinosiphila]|nr:transposase [Schaedlerella arabinosiphila]